MLQGHGDDAYRYKQEIRTDFSTNVWYGREPAGLQEHIFAHWQAINKYPEVLAESLASKGFCRDKKKSGEVVGCRTLIKDGLVSTILTQY